MSKAFKKLQTMQDADLGKKEKEARLELLKLRAQASMGTQLPKPTLITAYKKEIARIYTLARQRENTGKKQ